MSRESLEMGTRPQDHSRKFQGKRSLLTTVCLSGELATCGEQTLGNPNLFTLGGYKIIAEALGAEFRGRGLRKPKPHGPC